MVWRASAPGLSATGTSKNQFAVSAVVYLSSAFRLTSFLLFKCIYETGKYDFCINLVDKREKKPVLLMFLFRSLSVW